MSAPAQILGRRSLFLLPTRGGLFFGATLLALLLAAMNYGNGPAYGLTFLLATTAAFSGAVGQRNLLGLGLHETLPRADFTGSPVGFRVVVVNPDGRARYGLMLAAGAAHAAFDLGAHEQRTVEIPWPTGRRGRVAPPVLRLSSTYPFGLLRVRSRKLVLEEAALAYPRPAARAPLPAGQAEDEARAHERGREVVAGGDFVGLAPFRAGESPRHIHWKAAAAGRGLFVKRFAGPSDEEVWLALAPTGDLEGRLSILCRQVLDAERRGLRYGLRLGPLRLPPARGPWHREHCLERLALFDGDAS